MRKKIFYLTIVLPVFLSIAAGILIIILNSRSVLHTRANARITNEINMMSAEIDEMKKEQKELKKTESQYDKIIEENSTAVNNIDELNRQLESYNNDIENAKSTDNQLNESIAQKQAYLDGLSQINTGTEGTVYTMQDKDYKCPGDFAQGQYKAEGDGTFILKNIMNSQKDRVDLSTTDTHSYVFEIASGESITVIGEIKLTLLRKD